MNNSNNSPGQVIQYKYTSTSALLDIDTIIARDNSIPQNTEGTEILTLSITPQSASSKLLIEFYCSAGREIATTNGFCVALFQDSTVNALGAVGFRLVKQAVLRHFMSSGTTSLTTFKIRIGCDALSNHVYVNGDNSGIRIFGGTSISLLTITEFLE